MKSLFWHKIEPRGSCFPKSREGHSLVFSTEERKWYLFGGIGSSRYNDTYCLDTNKPEWTEIKTQGKPPTLRNYHLAWIDNFHKVMFVFGGQSNKREPLYDMHALLISEKQWVRLYPLEQPTGRIHSAGCILGSTFFLFGGASAPSNTLNNDLWSFSCEEVNWEVARTEGHSPSWVEHSVKSAPSPRKGHSLEAFQNSLLLFGGRTERGYSKDLFVLQLKSMKWVRAHTIGTRPSPRAYHGSSIISNKVMAVFGGLECIREGRTERINALNDIYLLNIEEMHWSAPFVGGYCPSRRYNLGMCWGVDTSGKEQLVVLGGLDQAYTGMDVYSLRQTELDPNQPWVLEDPNKKTPESVNESTILKNRKKIRELESEVFMTRDKILNLETNRETLKTQLEELHSQNSVEVLKQSLEELRSSAGPHNLLESQLFERHSLLKSRNSLYEKRIGSLEKMVKKAESMLITADHAFNEILALNDSEEFQGLSQQKAEEIQDRKSKHHQALLQVKKVYGGESKPKLEKKTQLEDSLEDELM